MPQTLIRIQIYGLNLYKEKKHLKKLSCFVLFSSFFLKFIVFLLFLLCRSLNFLYIPALYLHHLCNSRGTVFRLSFETEARILAAIRDRNIAGLVGANLDSEPPFMACEYSDRGDLNQYLQDHVAETSLSKSPGVATLR